MEEDILKNMWCESRGHETYIFHNGMLICKRWRDKDGNKTQPSVLFNNYWPNEEII